MSGETNCRSKGLTQYVKAKGNIYCTQRQVTILNTESRLDMETKLRLISKHIIEERDIKLTSLAHLLNQETLRESFYMLKRGKATGVDEVTFEEYEENLSENLEKLVNKMKSGSYYPQPVRRTYINKDDGKKQRPLGIPTIEDKMVQKGIARILNAIYEPLFMKFSYGFRPGRSCIDALDKLDKDIMKNPVNHVIDADIKGFFDNVDHNWLMRMLEEKIVDKNFLKLIEMFLKAGIMEEGKFFDTTEGTPQGGVVSPILANVYLHYVLDLWFEKVLKGQVKGYISMVRYADDFVIVIQYKSETKKVRRMLEDRVEKFNLELSSTKTRTIEFGKYARKNAERKGKKPDSFDFLGFTHFCDKSRKGNFKVGRKTKRKKFNQKIKGMNKWLKSQRSKRSIKDWWYDLAAKLRGHYEYYGISGNFQGIRKYYFQTLKLTFKWINRRSQKRSMTLKQFYSYLGNIHYLNLK